MQQVIAEEGVAIALVPEADIRTALKDLFEAQALVVEPSSAITLAFVITRVEQLEEPICVILQVKTSLARITVEPVRVPQRLKEI